MNKEKIYRIISAVFLVVLGVMVAINGGGVAIDIYFGVVLLVAGASLFVIDMINLSNNHELSLVLTTASFALICLGAALLTPWLSFSVLIYIVVFALIGVGGALIFHGFYLFSKKVPIFFGVGEIVAGAALLTFCLLFLFVEEFRRYFWIIMGSFLIVYGVFYLVETFVELPSKK